MDAGPTFVLKAASRKNSSSGIRFVPRAVVAAFIVGLVISLSHPMLVALFVNDVSWLRTIGASKDCRTTRFEVGADSEGLVGIQHVRESSGGWRPARIQSDVLELSDAPWIVSQIQPGSRYDDLPEYESGWAPSPHRYFKGSGTVHSIGYGWPKVSLVTDYVQHAPNRPAIAHAGIPVNLGKRLSNDTPPLPRAIPLRFHAAGFVINTSTFALAALIPILAIAFIRNSRAAKSWAWNRGRCPRCRYEVGDHDRCSECGELREPR